MRMTLLIGFVVQSRETSSDSRYNRHYFDLPPPSGTTFGGRI